MQAPRCRGCAQTLSADRKGQWCRWCEPVAQRAAEEYGMANGSTLTIVPDDGEKFVGSGLTEPEPLCSLCGLEDGACICAHLPKRATEPEPEERDLDPEVDGGHL